jgi:hypothetical protein
MLYQMVKIAMIRETNHPAKVGSGSAGRQFLETPERRGWNKIF